MNKINTDCYRSDDWILKMFEDFYDPCPLKYQPEIDALNIEWKDKTYCNPPYSNPLPFIKKAIEESKKGKMIVLLLKMDTSTKWFKELQEANAHFLWINGRLHYNGLHHTYKGNVPFPFPSMFAILDGQQLNSTEVKNERM